MVAIKRVNTENVIGSKMNIENIFYKIFPKNVHAVIPWAEINIRKSQI